MALQLIWGQKMDDHNKNNDYNKTKQKLCQDVQSKSPEKQ